MSDEHEYSRDAEIRDTTAKRPHVVILGAGASRAAFPTGERNGRRLPVMNDLIEVVGLQPTLTNYRLDAKPGTNFETVYSALHQKDSGSPILREIETNVDEYFSALQLPDRPTIYDHLVLSLREKDLIATFNLGSIPVRGVLSQ